MHDYGVVPQSIPPLLTRSGERFEERIETVVDARYPTYHFVDREAPSNRADNNAAVVAWAQSLVASTAVILFQPGVQVTLEEWRLRGDVDILRLERDDEGGLHVPIADVKSSTAAKVVVFSYGPPRAWRWQ